MTSISIEISDDGSVCTSYYQVEYKLASTTGYTLAPNAYESPIVINQLEGNTLYDFRITRFCCDNTYSLPLEFQETTTVLDVPTNFGAAAGDEEVTLTWDDMAEADSYVIDRATDAGFTANLAEVYSGVHTASVADGSLTNGTEYFYRIKSLATGMPDSAYATDSATPTP